jgi:hypothetical protein
MLEKASKNSTSLGCFSSREGCNALALLRRVLSCGLIEAGQ